MSRKKVSVLTFCLFVILFFILTGAYINSTDFFRRIAADHCKASGRYPQAIAFYKKIIRKDSVKKHLIGSDFASVNFNLGYLYAQIGLTNSAIESYASGSARSIDIKTEDYYSGDLEKDRLIAVGLLEAGNWDAAIDEFQKMKRRYPRSADIDSYLRTADSLKQEGIASGRRDIFFDIGDAYIRNRLFDEARPFFTRRILDYGVHPLEVLRHLRRAYYADPDIKQKVWGDEIYVTLEDFERIKPHLKRWITQARPRTNDHHISDEVAFKGARSEFLDILYSKKDYDYWIVDVDIPLDGDLPLGLRVFVKSKERFIGHLKENIIYSGGKGSSVIERPDVKINAGDGWEMQRTVGLYEKAQAIGEEIGCGGCTIKMDKVIIDTAGGSNQFYVDDIELFIE
ncbi:MAG: tetratricopeptide repeat protein [Candidatus Omnitrophica bacterium]|nr:tetratricopeptide repeat protein [Candidatus Omnitrophota bacterium]